MLPGKPVVHIALSPFASLVMQTSVRRLAATGPGHDAAVPYGRAMDFASAASGSRRLQGGRFRMLNASMRLHAYVFLQLQPTLRIPAGVVNSLMLIRRISVIYAPGRHSPIAVRPALLQAR
jgi:hypothetical protein